MFSALTVLKYNLCIHDSQNGYTGMFFELVSQIVFTFFSVVTGKTMQPNFTVKFCRF